MGTNNQIKTLSQILGQEDVILTFRHREALTNIYSDTHTHAQYTTVNTEYTLHNTHTPV